MDQRQELREWLQCTVPALLEEQSVPAVSVAVLADGRVTSFAHGTAHVGAAAPVAERTPFQIGSITKVWTATLVMQLVDAGRIDLDAPVQRHLPEFRTADPDACATISVRHLLTHSAGFEGDLFHDTGDGPGCIARYVERLATAPQFFAPGRLSSYNNAGFVVLGRILEVVHGVPFERVLRDRLLDPLEITGAATGIASAGRLGAAHGHVRRADGATVPARVWGTPMSMAPAGSMLAMSASDLVRFAMAHLGGGLAPTGERVLSERSATAMRASHLRQTDVGGDESARGLGWELFDWHGAALIGHDGTTIGQEATLRMLPEHGIAVAVLTNGEGGGQVAESVAASVIERLTGLRPPARPVPTNPTPSIDPHRFVGTYATSTESSRVYLDHGELRLVSSFPDDADGPAFTAEPVPLIPWCGDIVMVGGTEPDPQMYAFIGADRSGRAEFLYGNGRADPRR
ncbi:serine hydrolase domain-containing protein [Nocardiopsis tropica]|uniref:serine hydrolase domain-containing protein n=1 Tax=Tsukamurella strandjordii TaxID=147577 RepID=UPI0031DC5611